MPNSSDKDASSGASGQGNVHQRLTTAQIGRYMQEQATANRQSHDLEDAASSMDGNRAAMAARLYATIQDVLNLVPEDAGEEF
ncbi:expressed unknown protein [Seminavis robusta]|uniref:Uncharacterized protein n=1 Tax=Seminavis robusta TaxID=568900 RepID=A0A9N8DKW7_9STRA|nr:expressed unknown protein [Seminavis robusta]|eukprot:Sro136_g064090.1 n/a (83) ;mRNA; r:54731-54979